MNPQTKSVFDQEQTIEIPAQERGVSPGEYLAVLSAEQVYAQRLAENPFNGDVPGPVFIP